MAEAAARHGFLHAPGSEAEVCILFGRLMPYIGEELRRLGFNSSEFYIDEWTEKPTDSVLRVGNQELRVEFELYSSNFVKHKHSVEDCDLVVCWEKDWEPPPQVKVLELSGLVKTRCPEVIANLEPKYPGRARPWRKEEFMTRLRSRLSIDDYNEISQFIAELEAAHSKGIELIFGRGSKTPTLNVYFRRLGSSPLSIDANGKASIGYYNNGKPNFPEEKISEVRRILRGPDKEWHIIRASDTKGLVNKLRKVVEIINAK